MTTASNYLETNLVKHIFRTGAFSKPTTLAIALCTAATNDADDGSTITKVNNSMGYARQVLNPGNANWLESGGQAYNAIEVSFGPASGSWGTINTYSNS